MALLTFDDVSLSFGGLVVLDAVSFEVAEGELFALIGPNGAGKTSVLNCINGVYRPDRGSITFAGRSLTGLRPHRIAAAGVARVFQNVELFANLTVVENLMLGRGHLMRRGLVAGGFWLGPARREEARHRAAVERVIDFLDLEAVRLERVSLLPYGAQKRVQLALGLCMDPQLLLLDEPVAGMNAEETEDMVRSILDVQEEFGITMILVEHDMSVVMDVADRVLVLDFGRTISLGTPQEVQADPEVVRAYLGRHVAAEDRPATPEGMGSET